MELLNKMSYELYNSWTSIKSLINGTIGTMTDQNATALAINKLIAKYLDAAQLIESICLMHNIYNSITPALNRLTMERIQLNQDKELLRNTMNLDILCIANRIQNVLNVKNESIRNKGEIFEQYEAKYEGGTNSEFGRVIGDRKINQLKNVHAILSRRKCIKEFSQIQHNEKHILSNARVCYEYGSSSVLLRESIVIVNVQQLYSTPLLVTIGKDKQLMK